MHLEPERYSFTSCSACVHMSGRLDSTGTLQAYLLATLHFVKENWRCPSFDNAALHEVDADPHLRRITNKYTLGLMDQCFPQLLNESIALIEGAARECGSDREAADRVVTLVRSFFHCPRGLFRPQS